MDKAEIKNLGADTLIKEVLLLKKELFNLKMGMISGQVKDVSQFKKLRVKVAQSLSILNKRKKTK